MIKRNPTIPGAYYEGKQFPGISAKEWKDKLTDAQNTEPSDYGNEVATFTHVHGLQVLRLLSEYYAVDYQTPFPKDYRKFAKQGPNELLEELRKDADTECSEIAQTEETQPTRKGTVRRELIGLLGMPGADTVFFEVLKVEGNRFRVALPILKQKAKLDELKELARNKQVQLYQKDREGYGSLQATTEANIGALEQGVRQAEANYETNMTSLPEQSRGWILTQELLGYKKQLETNGGFALTPSRRAMIDRMLSAMMKGEKILALGSTGTGKTELAIAVAKIATGGKDPVVVEVHENMTVQDLMGRLGIKAVGTAQMETELMEGPILRAKREGRVLILDEKTTGPNRLFMGIKATLNNLERDRNFKGLIATGNIKDERTRDREETDPAVLRMYREAIKVPYMTEEEHYKVVLSGLMEPTGLLPFPKSELTLLRKLTQATRLMQMCHDRGIGALTKDLPEANRKMLADCFGGDLDQIHLDKNFMDTGTLLSLFKGWPLERAKGKSFQIYLNEKLLTFLDSAKFSMDENERKLARTLMELVGLLGTDGKLLMPQPISNENPYLLPSELGELFPTARSNEDPRSGSPSSTGEPSDSEPGRTELIPENHDWAEAKLDTDYARSQIAIETHFLKEGDRIVPSKAELKKAMLEKLTNAQVTHLRALEGVGRSIKFFVTPLASGARFKEVLQKTELKPFFKPQGQADPHVDSNYEAAIDICRSSSSNQTGVITEYAWTLGDCSNATTAKDTDPDASYNQAVTMEVNTRINSFNSHHETNNTGLSSMDSAEYAMLQVLKALDGERCDDILNSTQALASYTVLPAKDEENTNGKALAHKNGSDVRAGDLYSDARRLRLGNEALGYQYPGTRLRSRVMHKI